MKNAWKIAFRNFQKNKFYGFVNITGLATGMMACFFIAMYIQHEFGYDDFLKDKEKIYQVVLTSAFGGDEFTTTNTPPPVGDAIAREFPEVESFTRHYMPGDVVLRYEDIKFSESNVWMVDSNFLEFFSFPLIKGDVATCLREKNSIVLTETLSKKYFGEIDPIGQELLLENQGYTVTGVMEDVPSQSSMQFDILLPISASGRVENFSWSWVWLQVDTYVKTKDKLKENEQLALEDKFPDMVRKHGAGAFQRVGWDLDEYFEKGHQWKLTLSPISDLHLYSYDIISRLETKRDIANIYIFGMVGLFILFLACINFMNLSTARSLKRAKEVGVRKVLGSDRQLLVFQFLAEALLFSLVAAVLAIAMVQISLPAFNELIGTEMHNSILWSGGVLLLVVSLPLFAGVLAGSYPAFYLSNFQPIKVLKSSFSASKDGSSNVRSGLVVFQFAISIGLIICTLIVQQQIDFSMHSDLGMDKENVLIVHSAEQLDEKEKTFKNELIKLPGVVNASISTDLPVGGGNAFGDFYIPKTDENSAGNSEELTMYSYLVDDDFIPTIGIELLDGRNFDEERGLDSLSVIVNESTVNFLGWNNPIGKELIYPGGRNETYKVIGVMKDFHVLSSREEIEPFALFHESSDSYQLRQGIVAVKIKPGQIQPTIEATEKLWSSMAPNAPDLSFTFLDENIENQYRSEERLRSVLSVFTLLSIFIACLGLLGLIAYATQQRTKEIGIRKVLGASVSSIALLLTQDFLKLVLFSVLIAGPIAWFVMLDWLQDFVYQIDIEWWVFAMAGMGAMLIVILTVAWQSIKAAMVNPVESLRNE